jgi:hypothetical protein
MGQPGIKDLVGRVMIDREFLADLVRDPDTILAAYELTAEERTQIMKAVARTGHGSETERAREFRSLMMKRWAT